MTLGVLLPVAADTFTWTGGGANKKWSTAANWDPAQTMTASDTANFQTSTLAFDTVTYDSGSFKNITVRSGAWTANVATVCFSEKPITISSGAKFALAGANAAVNPFATNKNANAVAGLLDLGGAKQTIADTMAGNNTVFFRDGGEIRNGTVNLTDTAEQQWDNTTFTCGSDSHVSCAARIYLQNDAHLKFDGGTYTNSYTGVNNNHVIGANSGVSTLEVLNGAFAASSTSVGGLRAASGTTIDVADATFGGDSAKGVGTYRIKDVEIRTSLIDHSDAAWGINFTMAFEIRIGNWLLYHTGDSGRGTEPKLVTPWGRPNRVKYSCSLW